MTAIKWRVNRKCDSPDMSRNWEWRSVSPVVKWNPSVSQIIKAVVWILLACSFSNTYKLYLDCYQWLSVKGFAVAYRNKPLTLQCCVNTTRHICTERQRWVWVHQLPFPIQRHAFNSRTLNFKCKCAKTQNIQNKNTSERHHIIHVYGSEEIYKVIFGLYGEITRCYLILYGWNQMLKSDQLISHVLTQASGTCKSLWHSVKPFG